MAVLLMPITFVATNTASVCPAGAYCSGMALNTARSTSLCLLNGASGGAEITTVIDASAADLASVWFELFPAVASIDWRGGTWTVRLDVSTANANVKWDRLTICRSNSGGTCANTATIGSAAALALSLGTTGVKTATVTGLPQSATPNDKVMVILGFDNASAKTSSFGWKPNAPLDSPFDYLAMADSASCVMMVN